MEAPARSACRALTPATDRRRGCVRRASAQDERLALDVDGDRRALGVAALQQRRARAGPRPRAGSPGAAAGPRSRGRSRRGPASASAAGGHLERRGAARPGGSRSRPSWIPTITARSSSVSGRKRTISSIRLMNSGLKNSPGSPGQVRRHDQHGVGEVDRAALAVGEPAVLEHLQQDVEDVGVGLFDLVEEHHRVGPAAHRLGELAALLVADVAGRGADQPATRCASPCTRSCRCGPSPARRRRGTRPAPGPARSCPPRSARGRGTSRSGRFGSDSPARLRRMALATARTASSWPTTRACEHRPPCGRACRPRPPCSRVTGTPVQRLTTSATSSASTSSFKNALVGLELGQLVGGLVDPALELGQLAVADGRGAGQVAVALEALGLAAALLELLLQLADARDGLLLGLPVGGHGVGLLRAARPARPRGGPGARRRPRRSPSRAPSSRSRAGACAGSRRRARSASSRSRCAAGWPPRRSGRWPCRAGTGR